MGCCGPRARCAVSAVRAAAYRHAARMVSLPFRETTSFTGNAQAMVHAEIALPEDAPDWADNAFGHAAFADALRLVRAGVQAQGSDMSEAAMQRVAMARVSEQLWNAVEHGEHRLNIFPTRARYARSLTVALPRELDQAAQIALMQGYVRASLCDRGMVADWVIHDKSDADDVAGVLSRLVAEPETFLRLFREAMSHRDLVVLAEDGGDGQGRVYSTGAQVRGELAAVDLGTRLALGAAAVDAPALAMTSGDAVDLNAGQRVALAHGCEPGRLRLIRGEAGTGKTLVAARLAAVYRRAGWQVVGLTPTGAGLDALRDAGLTGGRTLRQFTRDRRTGRLQLDPGTVVVLDDAGRLGGREAGELLADIEASGAKLIALMDGGLQAPLEAGPVLRAVETRVGSARLEDMQWRTEWRAEALRLVAAGDARGIEMLREAGVIQADGTLRGAAAAVALRYLTDGHDDKIALAWSRAEADLLTRAIRAGLDELHAGRAVFEPETGGAFAGLKPGDRIRFIAAGRWQKGRPGKVVPPRIRAGETAELVGRDGGRLRLRIEGRSPQTGRMDVRDVLYAPNSELPDWRFAFAGTIHGEMGRAHDSVHLLAAPGLNRQVLAAGLNLHLLDLTVTVPCAAARLGEVMGRILRRTASAPSVIDYGFDASLGAREALRGQVYQEAAGSARTGMARSGGRGSGRGHRGGDIARRGGAGRRSAPGGGTGCEGYERCARLAPGAQKGAVHPAGRGGRSGRGCCRPGRGRPSSDAGPDTGTRGADGAGDGRGPGGGAF